MNKKKEIWKEYPSIFHYTTPAGIKGILTDKTLWASHYGFLNDATEVTLARDILIKSLDKKIPQFLKEHPKIRKQIKIDEKNLTSDLSEILVNMMYRVFTKLWSGIYVTSFCSHKKAEKQIYKNGLLSQWRGYGIEGGYAIEFDTKKITELESSIDNLIAIMGGEKLCSVIYNDKDILPKEFNDKVDNITANLPIILKPVVHLSHKERSLTELDIFNRHFDLDLIREIILDGKISSNWTDLAKNFSSDPIFQNLLNVFLDFLQIISKYKHSGFSEEREIRTIFVPISVSSTMRLIPEELSELKKTYADMLEICGYRPEMERKIKYFDRGGLMVPYIELFLPMENLTILDAIKRIIVGPHPDKWRRADALEHMLKNMGRDIPVTVSNIPFIEFR